MPRPGLISHFMHWSWKTFNPEMQIFNHTDSVVTKSCEPLGARNSQHDVLIPFHSMNSRSPGARLGKEERQSLCGLRFLHNKVSLFPSEHTENEGSPRATPTPSPTTPHLPFHFCLGHWVRRLMKTYSKLIKKMSWGRGMNIRFPFKSEYAICT